MGKMIDGEWTTQWYGHQEDGEFVREDTVFRGEVPDRPEAGRYHLYVSYACPWAHRTLIVRALKGLDEAISVAVVAPLMGEDGWVFDPQWPGATEEPFFGKKYLREVYKEADEHYTGRVTVPVLWDRETNTIANNESRKIIRMFSESFEGLATRSCDLLPEGKREEIDGVIDAIYDPINNGVYRAGFAGSQGAYERAVRDLFEALDRWEGVLAEQRFLVGDTLTEADVCMFTTLLRFDPVYVTHFKCNLRRIADYPNLSNYMRDIYQRPGVAQTCNLDHIRHHYYRSHPMVNPKAIVAVGFSNDLDAPHDRDRFGE